MRDDITMPWDATEDDVKDHDEETGIVDSNGRTSDDVDAEHESDCCPFCGYYPCECVCDSFLWED